MEEETKKKKKTAEEKAMEGQFNNLMEMIIAKTFSRHSKLTEEEFLKAIGFEGTDKSEDEVVRIAFLNVLVATTKKLLSIRESFKLSREMLKLFMLEQKIDFEEEKGEE